MHACMHAYTSDSGENLTEVNIRKMPRSITFMYVHVYIPTYTYIRTHTHIHVYTSDLNLGLLT